MNPTTTSAPYVAHQGEPCWFGDALFEFLIPSEATGGQLCVFRATLPRGFAPPLHVHTREDEVFLVLDGDATFEIDGRRLAAGPGTSVYMPRGVPHGFVVSSPVATMLGVMTPGAFEQLFRALGTPAAARTLPPEGVALDVATVMAEQRALGTEVVGPPLRLESSE
jgi:mannose-6-phosphate isomerase-like protein (cupin superfamily)